MTYELIAFLATAFCSVVLVFSIIKLSHKKSWYDHTNERKIHSGNIPRLGGIGFAPAFLLIAAIIIIFTGERGFGIRLLPCLAGILLITGSGVWDDFRPMRPLGKFLIQIIAALCVVIPGFTFKQIFFFDESILLNYKWLGSFITVLWIVGLTNAINLLDGIDGLAGGISILITIAFGFIFYLYGKTSAITLICACMAGALAGFLVFNAPTPSAKIFMGDGGSQFLGFTLALVPLLESLETAASLPVLYAAALFIIPILDTTAAVWRRVRDRQKISTPDKAHIHHKLMNLGFTTRKIDALLFCLQIILIVLVLFSMQISGWPSIGVLGIAYLLAFTFFITIHYLNRKICLYRNQQSRPEGTGFNNFINRSEAPSGIEFLGITPPQHEKK